MKIKEHWFFGCTLPATIHRLINEDLDIYNIGNVLGNSHEKYNIKENDYVIFFIGFNDIQKNINKYASNMWQKEIENLFTAYVNKVITLSNKAPSNPYDNTYLRVPTGNYYIILRIYNTDYSSINNFIPNPVKINF